MKNATNIHTAPDYSSAAAIMLVILWTDRDFCNISDCRNSFNNKLQTYQLIIIFFIPANKQFSSEDSFKEKCHTFIGMCLLFSWFNMQILNLCHR